MSDDNKVVFLAYSNPQLKTETVSHLSCSHCRNKTWRLTYEDSQFPRLTCACCGTDGGLIGWVGE